MLWVVGDTEEAGGALSRWVMHDMTNAEECCGCRGWLGTRRT